MFIDKLVSFTIVINNVITCECEIGNQACA